MPDERERGGRTAGLTDAQTGAPEPVELVATEGPGQGARSVLEVGSLTLGSGEGVELRVADPSVSRQHARVELVPGGVKVQDLGSTNGTSYLGAKIHEARVPVGGTIKVGRTTLRIDPRASARPASDRERLGTLIGRSLSMRTLFYDLERLAPGGATVLIAGETGTGKDAVAKTLHELSGRRDLPFVVFDCAAVSSQLFEAELFGHAKGAFTGADKARAGAVERALGGTLFLDEVGELPLEHQPKLLRLLEQREVRRVGEGLVRKTAARFIAATHRDLAAEVKQGRFREDLWFRLSAATVRLPPLRERREDIPLLIQRFTEDARGVKLKLEPATLAALQSDPWPGNVRELRNAVEAALALGAAPRARAQPAAEAKSFKEARDALLHQFEHDYLSSLLATHQGNVSAAARAAGLARSAFYRLLERHDLAQGRAADDRDD